MTAVDPVASKDSGWQGALAPLRVAGYAIAGYLVLATLVWGGDQLGGLAGQSWGGIAGLAVAVGLLTMLVVTLARRGSTHTGSLVPLLALLAVVLFFAVADSWFSDDGGTFWTIRNLRTNAAQMTTVAVAALGMTMIVIAGGIDLSTGTALSLSATVMAVFLRAGWRIEIALLASVLTGVVCGVLNGSAISALRIVPFIVTLGTMTAYLGVGNLLANQTTVRPERTESVKWINELVAISPSPAWLAWPLAPNYCWGVWLMLLLALLAAVVLHATVFGRHVYAIGSNEATARLCGVPVARTKILVYSLAGVFVGMAGIYLFARLTNGSPNSGLGLELKVIAAVVIGGGSLSGGRGSIVGTLCGAAIMQVISSGCTHLGLQNPIENIVLGAVIVTAVAFDGLRQPRS